MMSSTRRGKRPREEELELNGVSLKRTKRRRVATRSEPVNHSLRILGQFYPRVLSLRDYVLQELPKTSRLRKRKISCLGRTTPRPHTKIESQLSHLLDSALVGAPLLSNNSEEVPEERHAHSQVGNNSAVTLSDGLEKAIYSQGETVNYAIWQLLSRERGKSGNRPKHLLCDNFHLQRGSIKTVDSGFPNLFGSNHRANALKERPWPQFLALLGRDGEKMMKGLLLDCGIFSPIDAGVGNLYQLSGVPMQDLPPIGAVEETPSTPMDTPRAPSDITFVRTRIFYAKAATTATGNVNPGFRHIHILNRAPFIPPASEGTARAKPGELDAKNEENTARVMAYVFPRQFGLHNVFTSQVDRKTTTQKFQDYTHREDEISKRFSVGDGESTTLKIQVPKRLRGEAKKLVQRLQVLHGRCSYAELLRHYCPIATDAESNTAPVSQQAKKTVKARRSRQARLDTEGKSLVDLATPASQVSTFCQAVLSDIVPNDFWGYGPDQGENRAVIMKNVNRFIRLRRFEAMNLHDTFQGVKLANIAWLAPAKLRGSKMSQTDKNKRLEIFCEFLYYVFDSLLIPLIRGNFYVTESNKHKYRLFYFRHDVWRRITEPAMAALKANMFEEIKPADAQAILDSRRLGSSTLRLLPKDTNLRPIMNLRRRVPLKANKKILGLGQSINSVMGPVHCALSLQKKIEPHHLGSAMFSVSDVYEKIKGFADGLPRGARKLYFAKVDVQSAFDTIPQSAVVNLMKSIFSETQYDICRHVEIKGADDALGSKTGKPANRSSKRWRTVALPPRDHRPFPRRLTEELAAANGNTIFVDKASRVSYKTSHLIDLLSSHVEENLVKMGKKYYRQKTGVPQGSVVSSLLCNYFYADMEKHCLSFLGGDEGSLLLRLIDDFLLITTEKNTATRFLQTLHNGVPSHGVTINPAKSLTNFPVTINGKAIASISPAEPFPYCGILIHPSSLAISKDHSKTMAAKEAKSTGKALSKPQTLSNALTVDTRLPGHNFLRKTINAFKIQSHVMFYDTAHNGIPAARENLASAFEETARKTYAYVRCLPTERRPPKRLWMRAVRRLVEVACGLLRSKVRARRFGGYECRLGRAEVAWECLRAFRGVVGGKEWLAGVATWIDGQLGELEASGKLRKGILVS